MLTPARAGLARSGVTRAGYPITFGAQVPLYAISNIARSGATRSNYTGNHVFIDIGGVPADDRVMWAGASLSDTLDETPTTGTISTFQFHPVEGQEVLIRLGSRNNSRRLFAGTILAITRRYEGKRPANAFDDCRLIDYTWGLGARQVRTRYLHTSVAAIVANLVATYAPGYTWHVETDIGAELVDEITFTETSLPGCLTQLTRRVGGSWQCDYQKTVQVFFENTLATAPRPLNAVHPTLMQFTSTRDLSQIVTRVLVEGGGVNAFANCAVGESILPVDGDPGWYPTSGGTVVCGPQRITYTGVSTSTGGGMVGPGASPSGAPVAALASGAGIPTGPHNYAITFTTASGESLVGPTVTITVGYVPAPVDAPTAGTATAGPGPEAGAHSYAVTFTTASGETPAGPVLATTADDLPEPTTALIPGTAAWASPGVDAGLHDYAVTFRAGTGETLPGPLSGSGSTVPGLANPSVKHTYWYVDPGPGGPLAGGYRSASYTFVSANGETLPAPLNGPYGPYQPGGERAYPSVPIGPAGTIARKYYRTPGMSTSETANLAALQLAIVINDNTTVDITDNVVDSALAAAPPTVNQTQTSAIPLSAIPVGPTGTTSRRIYRRSATGATAEQADAIAWAANAKQTAAAAFATPTTANYNTAASAANTAAAKFQIIPTSLSATAANRFRTSNTALHDCALFPTDEARKLVAQNAVDAANAAATAAIAEYPTTALRLLVLIGDNTTTTYTDKTPNASLGVAPPVTNTALLHEIHLKDIPTGGPLVTARKVYRSAANTTTPLKLVTTIADNTTKTYIDSTPDASLGATAPASNTATANQVDLTAIPTGAAGVTSRKIYRTAANQTPLKLLATLADNTTRTYRDAIADVSLGAAPPVVDTSGLMQASGAVLPGATTLQIASIGPFPPAGWAVIGNGQQVIRYTGVSGSSLTGIPASGPGSIEAAISYNSTVTAAPVLTGIPASGAGSIRFPILRGDEVNLLITVDDPEAQAALAALIGGDGIHESYIQDRRLSSREATARGRAALELKRDVGVELRFQTRDINTRAGSTIAVNLGAPFFVIGDFLVQDVTIEFVPSTQLTPVFTATASSYRLSFEDLLRAIKAKD